MNPAVQSPKATIPVQTRPLGLPLNVVARPAFVRSHGRPIPASTVLLADAIASHLGPLLSAIVARPVHIERRTPAHTPVIAVAIRLEDGSGETAGLGLSLSAARALIDPLAADAAGLRGSGPPTEVELGILEFVALSALDRLAAAQTVDVRLGQIVGVEAGDAHAAREPASLDYELTCGSARGMLIVMLPESAMREQEPGAMIVELTDWDASAGDADVELRVALDPIPLTREELSSLAPSDLLLLGRTAIDSPSSACTVVTTSGWELATADILSDSATVIAVRCAAWSPRASPALGAPRSAAGPSAVPLVGRRSVSAAQLAAMGEGQVIDFPKDREAPVELCAGGEIIALGELVEVDGEWAMRVTRLERRKLR